MFFLWNLLPTNRTRLRRWKPKTTGSNLAATPRRPPRPSKRPGRPPRPQARPRPPRASPWACPWTTSTSRTPSCQVGSPSPPLLTQLKCLSQTASAAGSFFLFYFFIFLVVSEVWAGSVAEVEVIERDLEWKPFSLSCLIFSFTETSPYHFVTGIFTVKSHLFNFASSKQKLLHSPKK